ncbi:MAG: hypothetical protein ABH812_04100 [bacterium]
MVNSKQTVKTIIDAAIDSDRFGMNALFNLLVSNDEFLSFWDSKKLEEIIGAVNSKKLLIGILRFSFLIEIVKRPKIETTKFESRWGKRLIQDDPRYASFEECVQIYKQSTEKLVNILIDKPESVEVINAFLNKTQVAYEIPLDYKERILNRNGKIHTPDNIDWYFGDSVTKVAKLRTLLLNSTSNPKYLLFAKVYNKIQVKSYLTDRVLTGVHKTNREKRWETHPESVHFALRKTCQEIEYTLVKQVFSFDKVPNKLLKIFNKVEPIENLKIPFRCPITLEPMSFPQFESELLSPVHGKSNFQVGHLNPLKSTNGDETFGHTAKNISWISSDGNRIQGYLSLKGARDMIGRVAENYEKYSS